MRRRAARQAPLRRYSAPVSPSQRLAVGARKGSGVFGKILVLIAMAVVLLVLVAGISTLFVEGKKARTWSNRLMRMRVLAQFVAILLIMAVFYFARH